MGKEGKEENTSSSSSTTYTFTFITIGSYFRKHLKGLYGARRIASIY
jgi:hypothetical protein